MLYVDLSGGCQGILQGENLLIVSLLCVDSIHLFSYLDLWLAAR